MNIIKALFNWVRRRPDPPVLGRGMAGGKLLHAILCSKQDDFLREVKERNETMSKWLLIRSPNSKRNNSKKTKRPI